MKKVGGELMSLVTLSGSAVDRSGRGESRFLSEIANVGAIVQLLMAEVWRGIFSGKVEELAPKWYTSEVEGVAAQSGTRPRGGNGEGAPMLDELLAMADTGRSVRRASRSCFWGSAHAREQDPEGNRVIETPSGATHTWDHDLSVAG